MNVEKTVEALIRDLTDRRGGQLIMCMMTTILPVHVYGNVTCPACDGLGEIDYMLSNPCGDTQYRTCWRCSGKKTIEVLRA